MSTLLRDGTSVEDPRLDRLVSKTTEHLDKYPLTRSTMPSSATPIHIGVNWYSSFSHPERIKVRGRDRWVIGGRKDLGTLQGGHATCLRPYGVKDNPEWWSYYDQQREGRCVEFSGLRFLSLLNRRRYDITSRWHYWKAQEIDEWPGGSYPGATPQYEGTSVRAFLEVARTYGVIRARAQGGVITPDEAPSRLSTADGIEVYRWATDWAEVRRVLQVPDWLPGVPLLNSWGRGYPKEVLLMDAAGERLLREDGEFGVVTDR